MTQTTRKFVTAGAIGVIALLLWWWSAGRPGEGTEGPGGPGATGGGPGLDVGPLVDKARLERVDIRRADRAAISGHVREPGGGAIAGATVCAGSPAAGLSRSELDARTCVTSEVDGSYRIEGLLPAPQFVHASAPGHVPGEHRVGSGPRARTWVRLRAGQETREVDVVLAPGGVELKGVVRDLSGGELEGALVSASYAYARSGPDGAFSLWVAPGEVFLEAKAEGYAPGWMQGLAPGQRFEIALTPESVLVGRVVRAADGVALEGAEVRAEKSFEGGFGPAITDAGGHFRIDGLKPGAYRLEAFHDEAYGAGAESAVLGLGETSEPIVIRAHPAYLVEGTVSIAGGGGCEQGWVRLTDKAVGARSAQMEGDGLVRVRGVLPGTYEVQVECMTYVPRLPYAPVAVTDAAVRGLRWDVETGQSLRGRVVLSEGTGVPGVHVTVDPQPDPGAPRAQTTRAWSEPTAADGRFEAVGLLPGRYRVGVYSSEYPRPEPPLEVTLPEGQDLEDIRIELPATGELRGAVKDSEGQAVRGVEVVLRGDREVPSTRTLDDGSFRLAHVPTGEYRVQAVRESLPLQAPGTGDDDLQGVPVTVATGEVREVQLVVESQHGRIAGRVVDSAGGPLSDAFVEATRESDSASAGAGDALRDARWGSYSGSETRKLTDQDGRFELTGLGAGNYTLLARRRGGGEGSAEHVATGSDVEIKIADAGSLAGTVRIQGGGTPQQFTVTLHEPSTGWRASDEFFRTGGTFRFPEVPRGNYQVIVEAAEGASSATANVADGGRGEVQVELLPLVTVRGKVVDAQSGAPIPAMQVRVRALGQLHAFTSFDEVARGQVTDAEGRYEVEKVAVGAAEVLVLPKDWLDNGYSVSSIVVQVPATGARSVDLPPLKLARRRVGEGESPGDLGLRVRPPAPEADPAEARLVVAVVRPGGPAMQAGLQIGDEIVSVDGQDVTGSNGYLFHQLTAVPAGTKIRLGLARGATIEVTAEATK